jgi:hypothetical protein
MAHGPTQKPASGLALRCPVDGKLDANLKHVEPLPLALHVAVPQYCSDIEAKVTILL